MNPYAIITTHRGSVQYYAATDGQPAHCSGSDETIAKLGNMLLATKTYANDDEAVKDLYECSGGTKHRNAAGDVTPPPVTDNPLTGPRDLTRTPPIQPPPVQSPPVTPPPVIQQQEPVASTPETPGPTTAVDSDEDKRRAPSFDRTADPSRTIHGQDHLKRQPGWRATDEALHGLGLTRDTPRETIQEVAGLLGLPPEYAHGIETARELSDALVRQDTSVDDYLDSALHNLYGFLRQQGVEWRDTGNYFSAGFEESAQRYAAQMGLFDESKHPRDDGGKFTHKGGGSAGKMKASEDAEAETVRKHGTTVGPAAEDTYKREYLKKREKQKKDKSAAAFKKLGKRARIPMGEGGDTSDYRSSNDGNFYHNSIPERTEADYAAMTPEEFEKATKIARSSGGLTHVIDRFTGQTVRTVSPSGKAAKTEAKRKVDAAAEHSRAQDEPEEKPGIQAADRRISNEEAEAGDQPGLFEGEGKRNIKPGGSKKQIGSKARPDIQKKLIDDVDWEPGQKSLFSSFGEAVDRYEAAPPKDTGTGWFITVGEGDDRHVIHVGDDGKVNRSSKSEWKGFDPKKLKGSGKLVRPRRRKAGEDRDSPGQLGLEEDPFTGKFVRKPDTQVRVDFDKAVEKAAEEIEEAKEQPAGRKRDPDKAKKSRDAYNIRKALNAHFPGNEYDAEDVEALGYLLDDAQKLVRQEWEEKREAVYGLMTYGENIRSRGGAKGRNPEIQRMHSFLGKIRRSADSDAVPGFDELVQAAADNPHLYAPLFGGATGESDKGDLEDQLYQSLKSFETKRAPGRYSEEALNVATEMLEQIQGYDDTPMGSFDDFEVDDAVPFHAMTFAEAVDYYAARGPKTSPGQMSLFEEQFGEGGGKLRSTKTQQRLGWDEAKHPRAAAGNSQGGQFVKKNDRAKMTTAKADSSAPEPLGEGKVRMIQAPKGGAKSEVTGRFYKGGQWMPVHGLKSGMEKPEPTAPKAKGSAPVAGSGRKGPPAARKLSKEEIEEQKAEQERMSRWDVIRGSWMGEAMKLGDRSPRVFGRVFKDFANEAAKLGDDTLKAIADKAKAIHRDHLIDEHNMEGDELKDLDDQLDFEEEQATDDWWVRRGQKKAVRENPNLMRADYWIQEMLRTAGDPVEALEPLLEITDRNSADTFADAVDRYLAENQPAAV